mmetsp:Transcript_13080/g.20200  ORF Transcript_13080/g.20200 Transcript_13080/m.20200 type:complete len:211 (+) Transcript_13080:99-731(+)|eukprot:CAMPEP_0201717732 /NCGR_PEP_ID=MMETSP0593-20130828/3416_1 /ASSEMBLY_ACC=CAM_ASM_000672 /TAXON_ID=267983 /ORGANISM="Skeletonema japonicum, Strain CCMP2506" /LENGTH=210 /DNA_ID=CAMNT_0048207865 /DNA_START=68 /DNA_END=700 /DNA_ORIENTATION=+
MNDYSINGWDNEYARLARAASQLRTISPHNPNNQNSAQQKQDQATSIQTGLSRLDTQLHNLESSMTVSSTEARRRRGLLDGLRSQLSEITGTDPSITGGIGRQSQPPQPPPQGSSSATAAALRHQDELIDDLAIGVGRLKTQTHMIHDESKAHVHLLNEMDTNVDLANQGLEDETRRAMRLREEKSVWRLHLVIVGLSVLLFLLILMGLS